MTILRCMSIHVLSGNWWKRKYRSIRRRGTMDVNDCQQCVNVLESEVPVSDGLDYIGYGTLRRLIDGLRLRHLGHGHHRNFPVPWVPSGSTIVLPISLGIVFAPISCSCPASTPKAYSSWVVSLDSLARTSMNLPRETVDVCEALSVWCQWQLNSGVYHRLASLWCLALTMQNEQAIPVTNHGNICDIYI